MNHVQTHLLLALSLIGCQAKSDDTNQSASDTAQDDASAPPWPEWGFHHWVWEDESTQESALGLVNGYLERDIPVGAIIIDSPWATGYSTFEWDLDRFPDPQGMIDEFHELGVRVFIWTVPGINTDVPELYNYAADNNWFMENNAGEGPMVVEWWKGEGSLIDYFNPEAVDWWHGLVDQTLAYGIDGWKCDGLDFEAIRANYSPGAGREVGRLEYSHAYYRDFFEYTRSVLGDDRLITARPVDNYGTDIGGEGVAFAPVDINWAGWVGDQDPTFEGLKWAMNNMYYSAQLNYTAFGSDIGGYREDSSISPLGRDKELLIRWAQQGAFTPIMENGGSGEHRPWIFDEEAADIYRRYTKIHYALLPYLMDQGAMAHDDGVSMMQFVNKAHYNYLLGSDILVAPILEEGGSFTVEFPEDSDWVDLFDATAVYAGGETLSGVMALDDFPVFVRAGSALADDVADGLLEEG